MANDVVIGAAMRTNLLSLQSTQRGIDATQLRLATGKKVNSALDNPQSFFQAQSLNNRASDLTRLLDGIGQSIRTIETADKGITSLTSLIEQADSIASEAQSAIRSAEGFATVRGTKDLRSVTNLQASGVISGTNNQFDVSFESKDGATTGTVNIAIAANDTVYDIVAAINSDTDLSPNVRASVNNAGQLQIDSLKEGGFVRISSTGANALNTAGFAELGLQEFVGLERTGAAAGASAVGTTAVAGRVISSAVVDPAVAANKINGEYVASASLNEAGYLAADADDVTLSITIDGTTATTGTLTGASTIQDLVDQVNNSGLKDKVTASYNTKTGQIDFTFAEGVSKVGIGVTDVAGGVTTSFGFGTGASDATIATGETSTESFVLVGSSPDLGQFEKDYNKVLNQIDDIVEDANYRGVNLLKGDNLTTTFNEDRSSTLLTEGADFSALGLGLEKGTFLDQASIQKSVDAVAKALETVRNFGSSISNDLSIIQTRQDFTKETINTLKAGASDLTDADSNEEGANLLALQTRQQLGVTSLSLASQSQQAVLRLF